MQGDLIVFNIKANLILNNDNEQNLKALNFTTRYVQSDPNNIVLNFNVKRSQMDTSNIKIINQGIDNG